MIVVDTNVVSYLYLGTDYAEYSQRVFQHDPDWAAPYLWRSEFRNILTTQVRHKLIDMDTALSMTHSAEKMLLSREFMVDAATVMQVAAHGGLSAYDAEFVTLARQLCIPLITLDKKILRAFPADTTSLMEF